LASAYASGSTFVGENAIVAEQPARGANPERSRRVPLDGINAIATEQRLVREGLRFAAVKARQPVPRGQPHHAVGILENLLHVVAGQVIRVRRERLPA